MHSESPSQTKQMEQQEWANHPYQSLYNEVLLPRHLKEELARDTGAGSEILTPMTASSKSPKMKPSISRKKARNIARDIAAAEAALASLIQEHGNSTLDSSTNNEYTGLKRGAEYQRLDHIGNKCTEFLDSIDFCQNIKLGKADAAWMEMLKSLVVYKNEHEGSTMVPRNYVDNKNRNLGRWVDDQRKRMKSKRLHRNRIDLLERIDFTWDAKKAFEEKAWKIMYERLLSYRTIHNGSTIVPQKYAKDRKLGRWVSTQRTFMKTGTLLPHRVSLLNSIDFSW